MKDAKMIAALCFLSDIAISVWSYMRLTDYDEYLKVAKSVSASPDLQLQVYQIMLQSFTFTLFLFLAFHLIIYVLFWKQKKFAIRYVEFYTILAVLSCLLLIFYYKVYWMIIPTIIYSKSFKSALNWLNELKARPSQRP